MKKEKASKSISFVLLAYPPLAFVIICGSLVVFASLRRAGLLDQTRCVQFVLGLLVALLVVIPIRKKPQPDDYSFLRRCQTLIHEFKHAALIVLSGNILTGIRLFQSREHAEAEGKPQHRGLVKRKMYKSKRKFQVLITLAPYFFPLFSLPVLIIACVLESTGLAFLSAYVGFALGLDLFLAYLEYRKPQADFNKVLGGRFVGAAFILSFHAMWVFLCLLYPVGGVGAYRQLAVAILYLFGGTGESFTL